MWILLITVISLHGVSTTQVLDIKTEEICRDIGASHLAMVYKASHTTGGAYTCHLNSMS